MSIHIATAKHKRLLLSLLVIAGALFVSLAGNAKAAVYWSQGVTISRTSFDGTVDEDLVPGIYDLGRTISGVAVGGGYIYWYDGNGAIWRANIDGTNVISDLVGNIPDVCGKTFRIAVSGKYIFWDNGSSIGRANLDGTAKRKVVSIKGHHNSCALAVDREHIYWGADNGTIERANLLGDHTRKIVSLSRRILRAPSAVNLAVSKKSVFWASTDGRMGRARLDGTHANQRFASRLSNKGLTVAAAFGNHIYLTGQYIWRVDLNGEHAKRLSWIIGTDIVPGLAVDGS